MTSCGMIGVNMAGPTKKKKIKKKWKYWYENSTTNYWF
jgi:hypothetical protein